MLARVAPLGQDAQVSDDSRAADEPNCRFLRPSRSHRDDRPGDAGHRARAPTASSS
jgi:hypothetical protein